MLPLCELPDIANDFLMSFPETEKVKDLSTGKQTLFTSQVISNSINLIKLKENLINLSANRLIKWLLVIHEWWYFLGYNSGFQRLEGHCYKKCFHYHPLIYVSLILCMYVNKTNTTYVETYFILEILIFTADMNF